MIQTDLGLSLTTKPTRKREFLAEMERVVPWRELVSLVAPFAPEGKRRALDKRTPCGELTDKIEKIKASIRAKVEHPFRVIKRQFGHVKVRYRRLAKNTA